MIYAFNAADIVEMAIRIEENGMRFYRQAREQVEDPELQTVFRSLEEAEVEHKSKFEALKSLLPSAPPENRTWDPDNEEAQYLQMMADMHVFTGDQALDEYLGRMDTPENALKTAIQFEKDSILFYSALRDAVEDARARDQVDLLVREEREHLKTLAARLRKRNQ